MIVIVVGIQLFTWFVAHPVAGTLVTIVVAAFLPRDAQRIFKDYSERELEAANKV